MQKLSEVKGRIETGALQLGEDWPGVFIRGDEALGMAGLMNALADAIARGDDIVIKSAPAILRELAKMLEACRSGQ